MMGKLKAKYSTSELGRHFMCDGTLQGQKRKLVVPLDIKIHENQFAALECHVASLRG